VLGRVIYGVLNVRSPAPPVIALLGRLGILIGEQIVPLAKRSGFGGEPSRPRGLRNSAWPHIFGQLPGKGGNRGNHAGEEHRQCESHPIRRSLNDCRTYSHNGRFRAPSIAAEQRGDGPQWPIGGWPLSLRRNVSGMWNARQARKPNVSTYKVAA